VANLHGLKKITDSNTIVISPDNIRKELTGNISDQSKNAEIWAMTYERVASALNDNKNVILDATNVKSTDRKRLMGYLNAHVIKPFQCFAKYLNVDPEIAKQRIKRILKRKLIDQKFPIL